MALLPQLQQIRDKQSTVILGAHQLQELSSIWSFVLDSPSVGESTCEQERGLISIMENNAKTALGHSENNTSQNISSSVELNTVHSLKKCNVWVGSSQPHILDQPAGSSNAFLPKKCCPGINDPGLFQEDDLYEDFKMDEVDLNIENYEELFGVALSHSEKLLENGGIGSLFGTKDMSATDSSCQGAVAAEVREKSEVCPFRKARADVRRRVKGHFVKVGDAYDYDPLTQTRRY